jgi:hypothetical protein
VLTDEKSVEAAVEYLRSSVAEAATARANRLQIEQYLKSKRAILMVSAPAGSVASQEVYALAHPDYLATLEGYRSAVEADETFRFKREAAQARIEAFKTASFMERALKL